MNIDDPMINCVAKSEEAVPGPIFLPLENIRLNVDADIFRPLRGDHGSHRLGN